MKVRRGYRAMIAKPAAKARLLSPRFILNL